MQESFQIRGIFAVDPASPGSIRRWVLFCARLIFWPLALLTLVALALQLGAYRKEFKIAGPFAAETNPTRHSLVLAVPQEGPAAWWRQPLIGDTSEKPYDSILELQIDAREMGPPHILHETIRKGTTAGFSHWGSRVIFSLPPGVKNAPETIATLRYSVRPRAWVTLALAVSSALLGWLLYNRPLTLLARRLRALALLAQPYAERSIAVVLRVPYLILFGLCSAALTGSMVYIASSLYALATGWALPTTALIRWSPIAEWAARSEPYLGYLLLMLAGLGAFATWLAGSNMQHRRSVELNEKRLRQLLVWCGFPIVACAFIFCISAMWVGIVRPGDPNWSNIGGLVSFSDAVAYLAASYDQARDGFWNDIALHRPLAAAFRSVLLVFSKFSLQSMLILQACLVAGAVCFATHAVTKWRGVWAGTAFFALTYIYDREFVPTILTEPLGLCWALLSIPFFIEAFRDRSVQPALMAFAMTTVALMTRMGSMFTIPALLVWLVWQFGEGIKAKLRIFAVAMCILLSVFGLNSLLQKAYGTESSSTGGNFAYTLCGLTMGSTWNGCVPTLASEGKTQQEGEKKFVKYLYAKALENFKTSPNVFFGRLLDSAALFSTHFPEVIWKGYGTQIEEPDWLLQSALTALSLIGLLYIAARRAQSIEITFWALLWASIVASASMVYYDDGARTLAASHPMIALFFAFGMSNQASIPWASPSPIRSWRYASFGLIVTAALFVAIPWAAYHFSPIKALVGDRLLEKQNEVFVFGGRRMSGFLVVENGSPLRSDVPTLHLSDFEAIIEHSGIETYQGLLHPEMPLLPFGFVFAPRLDKGHESMSYIVPAEVVERGDVPAWHFYFKPWGYKPPGYLFWFYITKAEPWPWP